MKLHKSYLYASSALIICSAVFTTGCIKNDLPYPRIPQYITALAAVGESAPAVIDSENNKATVYLEETVDIMAVSFSEFEITEGATADPNLLEGSYDLSEPLVVNVSLYQDYPWIINA